MAPWVVWPIFTKSLCWIDCALHMSGLPIGDTGNVMPYWHLEGRPLEPNPNITLAVLTMHGHARRGDWLACDTHRALLQKFDADTVEGRVLVIGPQADDRERADSRPAGSLYWRSDDWKTGADGFYDVIDSFFTKLLDAEAFPALRSIVMIGHSAGAQLVQRFAMAGPTEEIKMNSRDIHLRYVASAPSSFLYLGPLRPKDAPEHLDTPMCRPKSDSTGAPPVTFEIPREDTARVCPHYDAWPYGFAGGSIPEFMIAASGGDALHLHAKFRKRDFVLLVGDQDVCNTPVSALLARFQRTPPGCSDHSLDTKCGAMLQGACRLSRARAWVAASTTKFGFETNENVTSNTTALLQLHDFVNGYSGPDNGTTLSPEGHSESSEVTSLPSSTLAPLTSTPPTLAPPTLPPSSLDNDDHGPTLVEVPGVSHEPCVLLTHTDGIRALFGGLEQRTKGLPVKQEQSHGGRRRRRRKHNTQNDPNEPTEPDSQEGDTAEESGGSWGWVWSWWPWGWRNTSGNVTDTNGTTNSSDDAEGKGVNATTAMIPATNSSDHVESGANGSAESNDSTPSGPNGTQASPSTTQAVSTSPSTSKRDLNRTNVSDTADGGGDGDADGDGEGDGIQQSTEPTTTQAVITSLSATTKITTTATSTSATSSHSIADTPSTTDSTTESSPDEEGQSQQSTTSTTTKMSGPSSTSTSASTSTHADPSPDATTSLQIESDQATMPPAPTTIPMSSTLASVSGWMGKLLKQVDRATSTTTTALNLSTNDDTSGFAGLPEGPKPLTGLSLASITSKFAQATTESERTAKQDGSQDARNGAETQRKNTKSQRRRRRRTESAASLLPEAAILTEIDASLTSRPDSNRRRRRRRSGKKQLRSLNAGMSEVRAHF